MNTNNSSTTKQQGQHSKSDTVPVEVTTGENDRKRSVAEMGLICKCLSVERITNERLTSLYGVLTTDHQCQGQQSSRRFPGSLSTVRGSRLLKAFELAKVNFYRM